MKCGNAADTCARRNDGVCDASGTLIIHHGSPGSDHHDTLTGRHFARQSGPGENTADIEYRLNGSGDQFTGLDASDVLSLDAAKYARAGLNAADAAARVDAVLNVAQCGEDSVNVGFCATSRFDGTVDVPARTDLRDRCGGGDFLQNVADSRDSAERIHTAATVHTNPAV